MSKDILYLKIKQSFKIIDLDENYLFSFLNPASFTSYFKGHSDRDIIYFCDSMVLASLFSFLSKKKIERVSFDYTSIARNVFDYAVENDKKVFLIGAEQFQIEKFIEKLKVNHYGIQVCGFRNGFFSDQEINSVVEEVASYKPDIVIASLGAGKQEIFISNLKKTGSKAICFTCGGFFRQESSSQKNYYPKIINKLGLRSFYRMYNEPHTIKRYIFDYPFNIVKLLIMIFSKKIKIEYI